MNWLKDLPNGFYLFYPYGVLPSIYNPVGAAAAAETSTVFAAAAEISGEYVIAACLCQSDP